MAGKNPPIQSSAVLVSAEPMAAGSRREPGHFQEQWRFALPERKQHICGATGQAPKAGQRHYSEP